MKHESEMIARHIEVLKKLKGKKIEAGWFESDRYPASGKSSVGMQVAAVARIQNFGAVIKREVNGKTITIRIPPRAFMNLAYENFVKNRKAIQDRVFKRVLAGTLSPSQVLGQIGLAIEGEIVKSIRDGGWEGNAASTIAAKGFDKPLINTAHMWKTVSSKVT